jgi:hypothetical protein
MEYYEEMRRVAGTFMKIRRAHRRDLGKIKDCRLLFKLNLKELLLPLLVDEVIDKIEYELLLLHPGGPAWKNNHVDLALQERLGECHDRYLEILAEMRDTMVELCDSVNVNDAQFQQRLKAAKFAKGQNDDDHVGQAQEEVLLKANHYVRFQAKRTQYAFSGGRREALLEELESQNNKLQNILAANDRVSTITQKQKPTPGSRMNTKVLRFWRHANDIYSILKTTWHCTCRSCLSLWLQHQPDLTQMGLVIPFCHGRRAVNVRLKETPPSIQLCAPRLAKATGKLPVRPQLGPPTVLVHTQATAVGSVTVASGKNISTVTYISQTQSSLRSPHPQAHAASQRLHLEHDGLCRVFSCTTSSADCIGTVLEGDHEYAVYPSTERVSMAHPTSLADLLRVDSPFRPTRVQRYGIALTLASSHLQLHSTPWLKDYWTSEDVFFPKDQNNIAVLHGEPYILANVDSASNNSSAMKKDRSFSTLGIVLLELCFGCRLEGHKMWQTPGYAALQNDPMMRQTIACEWLDDVQGEAGEDYAKAVNWTLRQSPATLKNEQWREGFAQNVVQPLQRYYEYLHPSKTS